MNEHSLPGSEHPEAQKRSLRGAPIARPTTTSKTPEPPRRGLPRVAWSTARAGWPRLDRVGLAVALALGSAGPAACGDSSEGEASDTIADVAQSEAAAVVGTWTLETSSQTSSLNFESSGRYTLTTTQVLRGGGEVKSEGLYQVADGVLRLETELAAQEANLFTNGDILTREQVYRRASLGSGVVGTWTSVEETFKKSSAEAELALVRRRTDTLVLVEGGTATYSSETRDGKGQIEASLPQIDKRPATFTLDGDEATLIFGGTGDIRTMVLSGDVLYDSSDSLRYVRQP